MDEIEVVRKRTVLAVHVPFVLKDSFRAIFPRARWNSDETAWEVPIAAEARVEEFAESVRGTVRALSEAEAAEDGEPLSAEDRQVLDQSLATLKARATELAALKQARLRQAAIDQAAINAQRELIAAVVDIQALEAAERQMSSNMNPAVRTSKDKFEEARAVFVAARAALEAAGLKCLAVSWLASANVNRPTRDHPRYMPANAWLKVERIDEAIDEPGYPAPSA